MPCVFAGRAKYARFTQVDACGAPTGDAIIDDCWPSLAVSPQITEGTDINWVDAQGTNCMTLPGCPTSNGDQLTWTFNHASPELFQVLTGATPRMNDEAEVIGFQEGDIQCRSGIAIETWVEVQGDECAPGTEGTWLYMLWPWVAGLRVGDYTVQNDALQFTVVGTTRKGSQWGTGPWDVQLDSASLPVPLFDPVDSSSDKPVVEMTNLAPPDTPLCELIPVESP